MLIAEGQRRDQRATLLGRETLSEWSEMAMNGG